MIVVILTIAIFMAILLVSARRAPRFLRVIPLALYPFYRYSGSLVVVACAVAAFYLPHVDEHPPQTMLWFVIPGLLFLALAFAKLIILILNSQNWRWWMIILKLNFGLAAVICFPVGLLAWACFWWFEVRNVQGHSAPRMTDNRWDEWQFSVNGSNRRDLSSHSTALTSRKRSGRR